MAGERVALLILAATLLAAPAILGAPPSTTLEGYTPEARGATKCAAGVEVAQTQSGTIDAPFCDDAFQVSAAKKESVRARGRESLRATEREGRERGRERGREGEGRRKGG